MSLLEKNYRKNIISKKDSLRVGYAKDGLIPKQSNACKMVDKKELMEWILKNSN